MGLFRRSSLCTSGSQAGRPGHRLDRGDAEPEADQRTPSTGGPDARARGRLPRLRPTSSVGPRRSVRWRCTASARESGTRSRRSRPSSPAVRFHLAPRRHRPRRGGRSRRIARRARGRDRGLVNRPTAPGRSPRRRRLGGRREADPGARVPRPHGGRARAGRGRPDRGRPPPRRRPVRGSGLAALDAALTIAQTLKPSLRRRRTRSAAAELAWRPGSSRRKSLSRPLASRRSRSSRRSVGAIPPE